MCIRRLKISGHEIGETWLQSMTAYRNLNNGGVSPDACGQPSLVPISFRANLFPALTNFYFPQRVRQLLLRDLRLLWRSYLDMLHAVGPHSGTFNTPTNLRVDPRLLHVFAPQGSSMPTWMTPRCELPRHDGHAAESVLYRMVIRSELYALPRHRQRVVCGGWFGTGWPWSRIVLPRPVRGSPISTFASVERDIVYELPFGKGSRSRTTFPLGQPDHRGWQVSSIMRSRADCRA